MTDGKWSSNYKALSLLLLVISCALCASGTTHIVGDSSGWELGVNYDAWTANQTFVPGDVLEFRYNRLQHDVVEVNSGDYSSCSSSSPIRQETDGNTTFTLSEAGTRYFICGISNHCSNGMRLQVDVTASSTASPPSPASTASPPPPVSPTNNDNKAGILSPVHAAAVVCAGLLVVGLGMF
ncbi:stellacyanin-like [Zingiber officinale]|uniref:Phytocyanin domain-containing protein n=1 Tax=Zingiber officinale TaxID=94328 RepID=A0A8J5BWV9_ZINOF|nr:stellacyanin-like [Zingiber officinale]KAG6468561.1 hypothetical protein ZIOFF_073249 [Zingiber officinale]